MLPESAAQRDTVPASLRETATEALPEIRNHAAPITIAPPCGYGRV
jgi:hypothetical protein